MDNLMTCDPTKLKAVKTVDRTGIYFGLARVPGTSRVVAGGSDAKVYSVDMAAEKPEWKEFGSSAGTSHEGYVTGVALAAGFVVTGAYDGNLIWWNSESIEPVRKVAAHAKWVRGVTASRDGRFIASVADDMLCKIWNAQTGEIIHVLAGHQPLTPHHYPSMLFCRRVFS